MHENAPCIKYFCVTEEKLYEKSVNIYDKENH